MTTPIKLKVELKDTPHKIVRKVLVPEDISMYQLHLIIQDSMGWEHAHLFEFSDVKWKSSIRVGIPDDFDDDFDMYSANKQDANKVRIKDLFVVENGSKPFWYLYDFGDDWWHQISFLKVSKKDLNTFENKPICIDAINKCPPEDIGGVWGYQEFLETVKDKNHPEREEMMEWYGIPSDETYDETATDLAVINQRLGNLYKSQQWNLTKLEMF